MTVWAWHAWLQLSVRSTVSTPGRGWLLGGMEWRGAA